VRSKFASALAVAILGTMSIVLPACSTSHPKIAKASEVGSCDSGVLFVVPNSASPGQDVRASAKVNCTPGDYPVKLSVVGQQDAAESLGILTASGAGDLSGTLHLPGTTPLGYARVFVVANFACPEGQSNCSSGIAGTVTIVPASNQAG